MRTIKNEIGTVLFRDNQPHVNLTGIQPGEEIRLVWPIRSSLELLQLLLISNALEGVLAIKKELVIPYLMGARSDRRMIPGDSYDLQVIANLINSCGFERVHLFDAHSDVSTALIHNSKNHNNSRLVKHYHMPHAVLICPDKGQVKKVEDYRKWNPFLIDVVYCEKERDLHNRGKITLTVLEPEKCYERNCVIIDDLCDGGATFLAIAEQIKPAHLTLIVSHGIFSNGLRTLEQKFQSIITSDSYSDLTGESPVLTVEKLNL